MLVGGFSGSEYLFKRVDVSVQIASGEILASVCVCAAIVDSDEIAFSFLASLDCRLRDRASTLPEPVPSHLLGWMLITLFGVNVYAYFLRNNLFTTMTEYVIIFLRKDLVLVSKLSLDLRMPTLPRFVVLPNMVWRGDRWCLAW